MNILESILADTKTAFKSLQPLDAANLIGLTQGVAAKVFALSNLSESEMEAVLHYVVKEGIAAAGGFPGGEAVESQVLSAALAAAKSLQNLLSPSKWSCCIPWLSSPVAKVLSPVDAEILKKAVALLQSSQGSAAPALEVRQVESQQDTPPQNTPETEPTPLASQ